ncbi:MAG: cotSA [Rickettsiaceae bacterium]|nr:cotSA [Rickettsiaceae bacterium]
MYRMKKSNLKSQKNKPVILQVLPELKSGGVERGTIEVVKALEESGFEALVASSGGHMVSQVVAAGGEHFVLPLASKNPFTMYKNIKRLVKLIEENDVDILHARSRAPAWSSYFACKKTGCHFVTTFHGTYSIGSKLKHRYNSVMVKGEKVIAISEFIKSHIKENYEVRDNDVVVIHRGADLDQFDHDKVPKSRIIHKAETLKIDYDKPIILLPGRITSWKGHEFLLDALAKLPKTSYMCLFAGDQEKHKKYLKSLNKKIDDLELSSSVRIIDNVLDMPALYGLVDIVVSASMRPEAFGRVAVEAQAMERLIVATNHGGACETIIDGKTGYLVEPGNVDQLTDILDKLLKISDAKRKTITSAAKKHIKSNFSLATMTKKTIDVYNSILGREPLQKEPKKEIKKEPKKELKKEFKKEVKQEKKVAPKKEVKQEKKAEPKKVAKKEPEKVKKVARVATRNKQLELIG